MGHEPITTHLKEIRTLLSLLRNEVALFQERYDQTLAAISRLERRSDRDDLTGLLRRNAFFERWKEVLNACEKMEENCGLLFVDVDHFKSINDTHGHAVGDEVLKGLGVLLKQFESPDVFSGRYGGEEFLVAVKGDEQKIRATAEWIRKRVENSLTGVKHTVSVGVANARDEKYDAQRLLKKADQALYCAKKRGRNQIKVA